MSVKLKFYLAPYRKYKEKAIEIYKDHGIDRMQEFCVVSQLELPSVYTLVLEDVEDKDLEDRLQTLIEFYDCEIMESK